MKTPATPDDGNGAHTAAAAPAFPDEPLPRETLKALTALEDARHELVTEEGLVVMDAKAPEESFVLDHERVIHRIDEALEPFAGRYDPRVDVP